MAKAIFQLEPLTCPSCIKKIETALCTTTGVYTAKVLFNSGKVRAEFNDDLVQTKDLVIVIEKLGFPVKQKKISL